MFRFIALRLTQTVSIYPHVDLKKIVTRLREVFLSRFVLPTLKRGWWEEIFF